MGSSTKDELLRNMHNTSQTYVKTRELQLALQQQGLVRKMSTIRSALGKCLLDSLAEFQRIPKDRFGCKEWRITQKGSDYVLNTPVKPPKAPKTKKIPASTTGTTPTSAGVASVSLPGNGAPTFARAVEDTVQEFVTSGKKFSAHDITVAVREKINAGTVMVDPVETGTVYVGGKDVPRIQHNDVRDVVHDLFHSQSQTLTGYSRVNNGQFWEYGPVSLQQNVLVGNPLPVAQAPVVVSPAQQTQDDDQTPPVSDYDGSPTL
jgi:hypothetical protein